MPDWITHLGTTYIAGRAVTGLGLDRAPRLEAHHLLLGALLPDATRFTIILVDVLDWPAIPTFTYLIPFHSLLIVALMAGALALVLPAGSSSRRAFGWLIAGSALHFLLDDLEGQVGCGSTTFYPIYFGRPAGWPEDGQFSTLLLLVSAIALGVALVRARQWPPLRLRLSRQRLAAAAALTGVALLLPLPFAGRMVEANAYYLGFVSDPAAFEGRRVELCYSQVISAEPAVVEEFDRQFELAAGLPLAPGEWVSVRGLYRAGVIEPEVIVRHRGFADVTVSLAAAVMLGLILWRGHYSRIFASQRRAATEQK